MSAPAKQLIEVKTSTEEDEQIQPTVSIIEAVSVREFCCVVRLL